MNLFYEDYRKEDEGRRKYVYVCSMCKGEFRTRPLLVEHKRQIHAY